MKVVMSAAAGMCFGVRDALAVLDRISDPRSAHVFGELVHNDVVLRQLDLKGFQQSSETDRSELPPASTIVITAHGISERKMQQLVAAGKSIVDTTCPLVARVHRAARQLAASGALVVVIGRAGHVEVEGIVGDLDDYVIVERVEDVRDFRAPKIGIICQTTVSTNDAALLRRRIEECNPTSEIHWVDTICQPTKDRQQALNDLCQQVDAVVVVGGHHSNNTRKLAESCRKYGLTVFQVQNSTELDPAWFDDFETVGLTGGTSTLPETLDQVRDRLLQIGSQRSHGVPAHA